MTKKTDTQEKPTTIHEILEERGKNYGAFKTHAELTQALKHTFWNAMRINNPKGYVQVTDSQRECIDMVFHKLGRIGNGDPMYKDSWVDIVGYVQLVVNEL